MRREREEMYRGAEYETYRRVRILAFSTPALLSTGLLLFRLLLPDHPFISGVGWTLGIVAGYFIAVVGFLMLYLQTGFSRPPTVSFQRPLRIDEIDRLRAQVAKLDSRVDPRLDELTRELVHLRSDLQGLRQSPDVLEEEQKSQLVQGLKDRIESESAAAVMADLKEQVAGATREEARTEEIERHFSRTIERLGNETSALARRGNLNLVLGITTTITGLCILGYYVFQTKPSLETPWTYLVHFVPRLTLVLFIEVFAYFFLRLYKTSLVEIKYFQNELTNVESRFVSLRSAISTADAPVIVDVIKALAATERNFVLKRGETTVELERAKLERVDVAELARLVSKGISKALKK